MKKTAIILALILLLSGCASHQGENRTLFAMDMVMEISIWGKDRILAVDEVEKLIASKSEKGKLVFVGDGINDAPVLARADIGIAMGGLGSDAAIEAADVVIMNDEPSRIALAMQVSGKTLAIVKQNIVFAIGIKVLVLLLAAAGYANMWLAIFADVGVAVLAILNAMRAMKVPGESKRSAG